MKTLFTTYVFGNELYYEDIPYYIYSVLETQPNAYVKIFTEKKLPKKISEALKLLTNRKFEIVEDFTLVNYNKELPITESQFKKSVRWIFSKEIFDGFDYGYIGDIDFLIYKENMPITKGHFNHCRKIGLPYSNGIRPNGKQMTGLHFIKVKEYFEKMENVINRAIETNLSYLTQIPKIKEIRNEHLLYELVKIGIGFNGLEKEITDGKELYFRPHHGIHLGILRSKDFLPKSYMKVHYLHKKEFMEIHKIVKNYKVEKVLKIFI
jgi:hypothetical protein